VLKGTRVTVRTVLASLAEGASVEEILADFPTLTEPAVRAVISFAAASAEEDMPVTAAPTPACGSSSTRICANPCSRHWPRCFVLVTDRKIRLHRPES